MDFELVIGDKNWSSWSLRPWLLMKQAGLTFHEIPVRLRSPQTRSEILAHSPSGLVPALKWRGQVICDSLAICETIAELYPEKNLWPQDVLTRAIARAVACEMHSGFRDLRMDMPMDIVNIYPGTAISDGTKSDIRRIVTVWREMRQQFGQLQVDDQGFLFGHFTVADAMYAPVVTRFATYAVDLAAMGDDGTALAYMKTMRTLPAMRDWEAGAEAELKARGL